MFSKINESTLKFIKEDIMFSTIQNTAISILVYFLVVFLSYGLYHLLKKRCKSEEYLKITRDVFKTIFFLVLLVYFQISAAISFVLNFQLLVIYGVIVIVFLFVFTKKESNEFALHTKVSAILLTPIIEEIICREIAYNAENIVFSFILGTVVFIVFHFAFDVKSIVYFFCIAFLLFGLRMQSGSVLNSMLLHSMINFIIIYRK
jgi:hypothetical protein